MKGGIKRITAERRRQIEVEEFYAKRDDQYSAGELALAAACYAVPLHQVYFKDGNAHPPLPNQLRWPWDISWYKRKKFDRTFDDEIRDLEKAGALIAAEIDRLERLKEKEVSDGKV